MDENKPNIYKILCVVLLVILAFIGGIYFAGRKKPVEVAQEEPKTRSMPVEVVEPEPTEPPTPMPTYKPSPTPKRWEEGYIDSTGQIHAPVIYTDYYVINTKTHKFHLPDCDYVKEIDDDNKEISYEHWIMLCYNGNDPCNHCLRILDSPLNYEQP